MSRTNSVHSTAAESCVEPVSLTLALFLERLGVTVYQVFQCIQSSVHPICSSRGCADHRDAEMQPHCVHMQGLSMALSSMPTSVRHAHHAVFPLGESFCFIPEFVHCLAELRSRSGGVLLSRHGCIHQNMVAVCLSYVYLNRGCTYELFQQILHHHC